MSRTRIAIAVLALFGALLALPGGALAAKPQTIAVDDAVVDDFLTDACGFEVLHTVAGTIRVSEDAQGFVLARFSLKHTLTGPGGSLAFPDVGIDKLLAVDADSGTRVETVLATGVLGIRIVVPGHGVVAANTGREIRVFTIDPATGEVTDFRLEADTGLDRQLDAAGLAAVCAALA